MFVRVSCAQLLGDYRGWFGDNNIGFDIVAESGGIPPPLSIRVSITP